MVLKDRRGQAAMLGLMVGIFIFLLGIGLIDPIADVITESRASSQLDCTNSSISDGQKLTCLAVDLTLPYFIVSLLALAGGWMTAKFVE